MCLVRLFLGRSAVSAEAEDELVGGFGSVVAEHSLHVRGVVVPSKLARKQPSQTTLRQHDRRNSRKSHWQQQALVQAQVSSLSKLSSASFSQSSFVSESPSFAMLGRQFFLGDSIVVIRRVAELLVQLLRCVARSWLVPCRLSVPRNIRSSIADRRIVMRVLARSSS